MLLLSACSGLAGEPQIVATLPPRPQVVDVGLPSAAPDIVQGAQIYAENCVRCHGTAGRGDGELVLTGQITIPPRNFTDPTTTRDQTPSNWFTTITNGRLENLMPPWRESLNESQRWAVALYTYTLSYQSDQIAQGATVFEANCAECHGTTGAGDGPRAAELSVPVGNLAQPDALIALSDTALFETIMQGKNEAMPAFADTLDDEQVWSVIAYTRTLSIANADFIGRTNAAPAATAEVEIASVPEVLGSISGQINNATTGGEISPNLNVRLHIFDNQLNENTLETTASSDGTFGFSNVPIGNDRAYIVTTSYQNHTFSSNMITGDVSVPELNLPITIYESTDDPSVITITGLVTQITSASDRLQVAQIMNFSNTSDKLYAQNEVMDGNRYGSIAVPLPPGAQILNTDGDGQRYVLSEDGNTLIDTRPVFPGEEHLVHVIYTLPYEGSANIQLPLNYELSGSVGLLVQPDNLTVSSEQLPPMGTQSLGGTVFQGYGATLSLTAGDVLNFSVAGSPANQTAAVLTPNLLAYALIAIGSLSFVVAATLYYFGRRMPTATSRYQIREVILEQIAELDELHAQGKIDSEAYQERRAKLKARIAGLWDKK